MASSNSNNARPQFGSRHLEDKNDVFLHNAWDNVEWDEDQEIAARTKVLQNSAITLTEEEIIKLECEAATQWDKFYGVHQNRFFKDRHWLLTEFPEIAPHLTGLPSRNESNHKQTQEIPQTNLKKCEIENGQSITTDPDNLLIKSESSVQQHNITDDTTVNYDLAEEISKLRTEEKYPGESSTFRLLEVGCGVGNTVFPILELNNDPNFFLYCCDFSAVAVNILKESPDYNTDRCLGFVCDVGSDNWTVPFPENSLDIILCIFVLSALDPSNLGSAVKLMSRYLKPGGMILFRDYGRYDMAQLRFKKGRCVGENFYVRGDGTRCYFITQEEVRKLMTDAGLEEVQNIVDRRLQVNRGKQLTMYRIWIQAKYRKPFIL